MEITDVRVRLLNNPESSVKAICSFTIDDCFVIHDVKFIDGKKGMFLGMPRQKNKSGEWKDLAHCLNNETRDKLSKVLFEAYNAELKKE